MTHERSTDAWTALIARFADAQIERVEATSDMHDVAEMLMYHQPVSDALVERADNGECTAPGFDEAALVALENRLGTSLPPSYRRFLAATDGLVVASHVSLLPASDVDWYRLLDPESVESWQSNDEATDAQYDVYGPAQDCIHMRTRHLYGALQISTSIDGDVLLLVPAVRFGDEWEAWFLGAKNPGAVRYRSFADMVDALFFVD
ncbi:MAG TPA: SMI1/KNR4 family protein [Tahibacter sp.]|nr:SMI1/KNR4 family protein [Tahibacter sp.]